MPVKIVFNQLLKGWFIVRGPHHTPIGGRYESRADAVAALGRRVTARDIFNNPTSWMGKRK